MIMAAWQGNLLEFNTLNSLLGDNDGETSLDNEESKWIASIVMGWIHPPKNTRLVWGASGRGRGNRWAGRAHEEIPGLMWWLP